MVNSLRLCMRFPARSIPWELSGCVFPIHLIGKWGLVEALGRKGVVEVNGFLQRLMSLSSLIDTPNVCVLYGLYFTFQSVVLLLIR